MESSPYPTDVDFRTELESRGVVFSLPDDKRVIMMSKGAYDNEASMNRPYGKEELKLDPSFVQYNDDGFYWPKTRNCDVLCDIVNNYYHSQYVGSSQAELDEMRAKIWTWCDSHPGDETLVSGWNREVRLMAEISSYSAGGCYRNSFCQNCVCSDAEGSCWRQLKPKSFILWVSSRRQQKKKLVALCRP